MPPISGSGHTNDRPLLERFISSSCASQSKSRLNTSDLPKTTFLASFSADVRLGLLHQVGWVVRFFCLI